ncbi:MAG: HypC/HybG/HupF family hydrogenase formation chaperone [Chloroflexota bacterium]|nr:HypC/HybG/HupF family hydrogenase formation chaperone [Chloroflexota bacterium]
MCVTLPGRVLSVEGSMAQVERAGSAHWYNALLHPELQPGDSVIVHAGLVLEVLSQDEAREIEATFAELSLLEQQLAEDV